MFMAVLSHDLRTPLQSIKAAATVLARQPEPDKVASLAERVQASSQRMSMMIEDLLDVTRIRQAGGLALSPASTDLQLVLQRTLQEVESGFPERRLECELLGDLQGHWDGERLCQVLSNLLGNAMHHGDPAQAVKVVADGRAQASVSVTVSNGGTIPAQLLPTLFNPFRGGERRPGQHQGLGLGLFIAHQIVRSHGGSIKVCSADGVTSFLVELPRDAAAGGSRAVL
jgi:signal transduction histidine kinase